MAQPKMYTGAAALLALVAAAIAAPAAASQQALAFHDVPPCRVVDTRSNFGMTGPLTPGLVQKVTFRGKCKIPGLTSDGGLEQNTVAALALNIVAVGPSGPGNLRAWAANRPVPNASVINYSALPGLNIANGVVVPMCDQQEVTPFPCQAGDISFQADVSSTHVVVDVTGYYEKPTQLGARRIGLTGFDQFLCVNAAAGVRYGLTKRLARWDTAASACPQGTWVCLANERGAGECDTPRDDSFIDALSCDAKSLDYPANAHLGWVRNEGSSFWAGMALSEAPNPTSENIAICANLPVWCCSEL